MQPIGSVLCSQEPPTGSYPEPVNSVHALTLKPSVMYFNNILQSDLISAFEPEVYINSSFSCLFAFNPPRSHRSDYIKIKVFINREMLGDSICFLVQTAFQVCCICETVLDTFTFLVREEPYVIKQNELYKQYYLVVSCVFVTTI
jgi:hypothetical protein